MLRRRSRMPGAAGLCLALAVAGCADLKQRLDRADENLRGFFGTNVTAPPAAVVAEAPPVPSSAPKPRPTSPLAQAEADWSAGRFQQAVARLRPLAEAGDAGAQYRLGLAHAQGRGVERDTVAALAWWHRAAVQGNAEAQYQIGHAYLSGEGVEEDTGLASAWLARAAARNHAPATYRLAQVYQARAATTDDEAERRAGLVLLERAAEQGHPDAQMRIGEAYATGREGVSRDPAWAVRWFGKAARQGVPAARSRLGAAHATGEGAPQDPILAAAWYRLAAAAGHADAGQALSTVEGGLAPDQRAQAERLSARLAAQPGRGYADVPTVLYVQTALAERGFDVGAPDGLMGAATRRALVAWQREKGLEADGVIGPRVLSALRGTQAPTQEARRPK